MTNSNFRRSALVLALVAAGVLAAGTTLAQSQDDGARDGKRAQFMAKLDTNQDGAITRQEFDAMGAGRTEAMDANRDGLVTYAEHKAAREAMAQQRFVSRHDQDGDGRVSVAELSAKGEKHFDRMDRNDDGQLTADEMQHRKGMRRGGHGERGHGGAHEG